MYTWIETVGWLSAAVEKICDFLVGMTVLRLISLVITPPTVSIPIVSGLTSRSTKSPVSSSPPSTPACTAAPYATASSGLIPRLGSWIQTTKPLILTINKTTRKVTDKSLVTCIVLLRVIGKGWQDVLTPPGGPQWRTTYHITTSVWKMPPSWHWTGFWRLLAASIEFVQAEQWQWWKKLMIHDSGKTNRHNQVMI